MNRTHLIIGLIVVSTLLAPTMLCLMPGAALTPAEAECCRQMASNCGDIQMPHACCKITSPSGESNLIAHARSLSPVTEAAAIDNLIGIRALPQRSLDGNGFDTIPPQHSPHLHSIDILRI